MTCTVMWWKGVITGAVTMIAELLLPALLVGVLVAVCAGSLGCFVIWRRMAFFSDALAHSAVLGTALALLAGIQPVYGLIGYGLLVALLLARFDKSLQYSGDTLLAMLAQTSLALGVLLLPLAGRTVSLEALLFGDILAVGRADVWLTALVALVIAGLLLALHRPLIDLCVDEELAAIEGVPVGRIKALLFCLLVALIAVAVQMVGVLLVGALLLMPAATARRFASTPHSMLLLAPGVGVLAVLGGLAMAWYVDTAAGPSIVVAAAALWLLSLGRRQTG